MTPDVAICKSVGDFQTAKTQSNTYIIVPGRSCSRSARADPRGAALCL